MKVEIDLLSVLGFLSAAILIGSGGLMGWLAWKRFTKALDAIVEKLDLLRKDAGATTATLETVGKTLTWSTLQMRKSVEAFGKYCFQPGEPVIGDRPRRPEMAPSGSMTDEDASYREGEIQALMIEHPGIDRAEAEERVDRAMAATQAGMVSMES